MTLRPHGRHRAPSRTTALSRSAAVAATSTGLLAGTAVAASADPATGSSESLSGVPVAETLVRAVETVAAAEKPAKAVPAPEKVDEAASFGTSGFTAVRIVTEPTPAEAAVEARTEVAASRSNERAAAPAAEAQPAAAEAAPAQQAAPAPEPAPAPAPAAAPAPTGGVLSVAAAYTGIPYVYGGATPAGFDCSGYTQFVFAQVGISLPRTAAAQQASATPVSNPQPGDLVFFGYPAYHVGIYAGNGMMYDSGRPGIPTQLRAVFSGVSGYGRVG